MKINTVVWKIVLWFALVSAVPIGDAKWDISVIELFHGLYVAPTCWNHILSTLNIIQFRQEELCYNVAKSSTSNCLCPSTGYIPHQTMTNCGSIIYSTITCEFSNIFWWQLGLVATISKPRITTPMAFCTTF